MTCYHIPGAGLQLYGLPSKNNKRNYMIFHNTLIKITISINDISKH